jgi:hypothetical protein
MEERHYPETAAGAPFYAAAMDERQVATLSEQVSTLENELAAL